MSPFGISEIVIVFALWAAGLLVPIVLVVLLAVWLINKKRRDNMVIERLIEIRQVLEDIRGRPERAPDEREGER
ncbi:hypothetical protein AMJ85_05640 [candidate division BRC1 bacterium SM23_51]|nr:MAG: hypothetical protein AMJ85_05640 [candidate division BRC1 bacterium SM23_51]